MVWMPVARPLAQLATLAKEPGLESGTYGCSLRHFLPPCLRGLTPCAPQGLGGGGEGGDMNVTGGDTFCLCFKESDVPFVNIQEKY